MKKLLLFVSCCLFGICTKAQINLEHTFEGGYTSFNEKYFVFNTVSNTVNIYNFDYSLYKTINISLPSGCSIYMSSVGYPSRHLFNHDDKFEFLIVANRYDPMLGMVIIYNEDGDVIKNITKNGYTITVPEPIVIQENDLYKLLIVGMNAQQRQTDVYSLPGTYELVEEQNYVSNLNCYPNPAKDIVTLQYNINKGMTSVMNIYDINGVLIETKNVGGDFNEIHLDVTNYPSGIYIYECNGNTNRFIKQ